MVITGGPGGGQDHARPLYSQDLDAKGVTVALAAPTGRAAKRLSESTGLGGKADPSALEAIRHGCFRRNEENTFDCDLLVVDETSMIDVPLMHALLKAVPEQAALILVGDVDQLLRRSGQVLADIIASGAVPVVRLTEVFRQAAETHHRQRPPHQPGLMPEWAQDQPVTSISSSAPMP